jgi:uncharacterized FlgJ-related protein
MALSASQKAVLRYAKTYGNSMVAALNEKPIYFSVMLTIASTESGYGKSYNAIKRNNHFGLMKNRTEKLSFNSPKDGFAYWVDLLVNQNRYIAAGVPTATSPYEQIRAMALGGYYDANNDVKSTLPINLQSKYGRITAKESADWYYTKNKPMLDAILLALPIGKVNNKNAVASSSLFNSINV